VAGTFFAICLHQLVTDERHAFPLASKIKTNFYVDDLTGTNSYEEELHNEMIRLLHRGGFYSMRQ